MMEYSTGVFSIYAAAIIALSAFLPPVVPCNYGTAYDGITAGTGATISTGVITVYVRCLSSSSTPTVTCRTTCLSGETELSSAVDSAKITDLSLCAKFTFYELCYDFSTDTSNTGTCTPDYLKACTGSTKKLIATVINDTNCGNSNLAMSLFVKCTDPNTNRITCRPQLAGCKSDETKETTGIYFLTTLCYNLGSSGLYDLCYDFTNSPSSYFGVCQPVELGCTGANKFKLLSSVKDYVCDANERTYGTSTTRKYIRCEVIGTTTVNCRPASVGSCKPDNSEIRIPDNSYEFDSLEQCQTGIELDSDQFVLCYDFNNANPQTAKCVPRGTPCSGTTITKLGLSSESTCQNLLFALASSPHYSCTNLASLTELCRSTVVGCAFGIERSTAIYSSGNDCYDHKTGLCGGGSSWGNCYCSSNCTGINKLYLNGFTDTKPCSSYCPVLTSASTVVRCTLTCFYDPTGRDDIVRHTFNACVPAVNCNNGNIESLRCTAVADTSYNDLSSCTATLP